MVEIIKLAHNQIGPTITVGEILVEIMATTKGNGFDSPQQLIGPYPSGAPAIFISQCARMGGAAAMIGSVGDDDFGHLNIKRLHRDGVDTSAISVSKHLPTGSAFVRYRSDGLRDFVYNITASAATQFALNQQSKQLIAIAGHLHIMGSSLVMPNTWPILEHAIPVIKSRGGTISLDPNLRKELQVTDDIREKFIDLIGVTDLLLPSGEELELAAGVSGQDQAINALFKRGISEIVLKRGSHGATQFSSDGNQVNCPAFSVDEVDPTGAGDCFGAAYLTSRRLGLSISRSLEYGCAAGAMNVSVQGPMEGAATRVQLDAFIHQQRRLAKCD